MIESADLYALMENLPKDSPAWFLIDAFDAVTNGLENPEAFSRMEQIDMPIFKSWKNLIYAIKALYAGDMQACRSFAEAIGEDSAPAVLKPFFRAWICRQEGTDQETIFRELTNSCKQIADLYNRIIIKPHPLYLLAEQAEEALRHELGEQFEYLALKVLGGLRDIKNGSVLSLRYAVYCLTRLDNTPSYGEEFFSALLKFLGRGDAYCALGFTLIGKNNRSALAAFRIALREQDGYFLDEDMHVLIEKICDFMEQEEKKGKKEHKMQKVHAELKTFPISKAPAYIASRQLDLFEST
ncbi:MAG: hypothetical protein LBQ88_06140 [Treponema sp.]|jgi:hypothetical protein|nr:hypothetical protein [Treponema sp.]